MLTEISEDPPADTVRAEIRLAAEAGAKSVGVFVHGNAPTAALSAALTACGVENGAVGVSESYGEALSAIATMLAYAEGTAEPRPGHHPARRGRPRGLVHRDRRWRHGPCAGHEPPPD